MAVGPSLIGVICFLISRMSGDRVYVMLLEDCRSGEGDLTGLLLLRFSVFSAPLALGGYYYG